MKTKGIAKRLLVMALALVVTNITVYQSQTVKAASKKRQEIRTGLCL